MLLPPSKRSMQPCPSRIAGGSPADGAVSTVNALHAGQGPTFYREVNSLTKNKKRLILNYPNKTATQKRQRGTVLLILLSSCLTGAALAAPAKHHPLSVFENGPDTWCQRTYDDKNTPKTTPLTVVPATDAQPESGKWLKLPVQLPGKNEFLMPTKEKWTGWQRLTVEFILPEGLPASTEICLFTKDWDHLWRQIRMAAPPARGIPVRLDIPLTGPTASTRWKPRGHQRPWHTLTPGQLLEFGCSFDLATGANDSFSGSVYLTGIWLSEPDPAEGKPEIRKFGQTPHNPHVGEMTEFSFELGACFTNPFSPEDLCVTATITTPEKGTEQIRGFYYEGFLYDKLADPSAALQPCGHPVFKIRYTPRTVGRHVASITVQVGTEKLSLPDMPFEVKTPAPSYKGFVRVDPQDTRFLANDNGKAFWGIGMNVRSPFDTRYVTNAPYSNWSDEGLALYERLFEQFSRNGIDVVEVWMSSWWLGLEWINDAPGYHGVGYMNQHRAWMLDQIVNWAEKWQIRLILVFNNHGKFGALNDTEWSQNPYNVANGGFLKNCEEFFSDPRAKQSFKHFIDYTLARWSYSPNVLMWKLFTEIDLTGTTYDFYKNPVVSQWHKEIAAYVKQQDLYNHLITTHWMLSYLRINDAVGDLPELDLLTADAYYQGGGTRQLLTLLRGTAAFAKTKKKPVLVTEYGGSPHADSMGNLIKQAHLGSWTGFFCGSPVAPLFWWFALADEKGLYPQYAALAKYTRDEDRRNMKTSTEELKKKGIFLNRLQDDRRLLVWGFDTAYYLSDAENLTPAMHQDFVLNLPEMLPGHYEVEYWNCKTGEVTKREMLEIGDGKQTTTLHLPPFLLDFALKIKPAKAERHQEN